MAIVLALVMRTAFWLVVGAFGVALAALVFLAVLGAVMEGIDR